MTFDKTDWTSKAGQANDIRDSQVAYFACKAKNFFKLRNDQTHKEDRVTRISINTLVPTIVDGCGKQITVGITLMPEESTDL